MLLNWRNNSATREVSHNTALINEDEHILWLKRILASENRKLYVAEIDGVPVGTVRVDSEALGYELSWTVSTTMRSSGIGKAMVSQLAKGIPESIRAKIKTGNVASIRIAEDDWLLIATRGSHRQLKHPVKSGRVTVAGKPSDDLLREPSAPF